MLLLVSIVGLAIYSGITACKVYGLETILENCSPMLMDILFKVILMNSWFVYHDFCAYCVAWSRLVLSLAAGNRCFMRMCCLEQKPAVIPIHQPLGTLVGCRERNKSRWILMLAPLRLAECYSLEASQSAPRRSRKRNRRLQIMTRKCFRLR